MKKIIVSSIIALSFSAPVWAGDFSTKLTDVHLCCPSCVKGAQKAVADVPGITASASQDEGTVLLTGADQAAVQKAGLSGQPAK